MGKRLKDAMAWVFERLNSALVVSLVLTVFVITPLLLIIWMILWYIPLPFAYVWSDRFASFVMTWIKRAFLIAACLGPPFFILGHPDKHFPSPPHATSKRTWRDDLFPIGTALLSGSALSVAILWHRLGVPPTYDHNFLGIDLFFYVETVLGIVAFFSCVKCRNLVHGKGWLRKLIGFTGIAGINIAFFALPVIWTITDAHLATVSVLPSPASPEPCAATDGQALIVHISDLHITIDKTTRDGKEPGNNKLPGLLGKINSYHPAYLVISGDLTDKGDTAQWIVLEQLLSNLSPGTRAVFAPGNHDLNQFFGHDPSHKDLGAKDADVTLNFDKLPRLGRFVVFQSKYMPDMVNYRNIKLGDLVRDIPTKSTIARFQEDIGQCHRECDEMPPVTGGNPPMPNPDVPRCHLRCDKDWTQLRFRYLYRFGENFPWMYIDEQRQVAFFSLASTLSSSDTAGQNAIGYIADDQIAHLQTLLRGLPPTVRLVVLILHHPLFYPKPPNMPSFTLRELAHPRKLWNKVYLSDWFLTVFLQNNSMQARKLYTMLSQELTHRAGTTAIVMFGHRHKRSLSALPSIILEEAPNIATETSSDYGFYAITQEAGLSPTVRWCQVMH